MAPRGYLFFFFFFNDTATTEIYTLSLHDALPISVNSPASRRDRLAEGGDRPRTGSVTPRSARSEEHTSELQSQSNLVCRLLLEKKKQKDVLSTDTSEPPANTSSDTRTIAETRLYI